MGRWWWLTPSWLLAAFVYAVLTLWLWYLAYQKLGLIGHLVLPLAFYLLYRFIKSRDAVTWAVLDTGDRLLGVIERKSDERMASFDHPWVVDAQQTMLDIAKRAAAEDRQVPYVIYPANPFYDLPLRALVKWGFATDASIAVALARAEGPEPPAEWLNPFALAEARSRGWPGAETIARIGLMFEWARRDSSPTS